MGSNVLIAKKLERDSGKNIKSGVHLRKNLKEIIAVEVLLEEEGWLQDPTMVTSSFENLDKNAKIKPEMTEFWFRCGENRENGIQSILRKEPVKFKDVLATDQESDSAKSDLKTMVKELHRLINKIPEANQTKVYISELFKNEIVRSKNLNRVTEFFSLVLQIVTDSEDLDTLNNLDEESSDSSGCESDTDV